MKGIGIKINFRDPLGISPTHQEDPIPTAMFLAALGHKPFVEILGYLVRGQVTEGKVCQR